ncbi:MAG TPA: HAMP domain-containing sensor histidine kinase, partial [Gemmatirosa sp.]|nr:HAMP domain-containing sensor histidine kinase [Gemmatirosa sp.]
MPPHTTHAPGAVADFLPHGFCYLWNPPLLWTHLLSDLAIGVAYVAIAFSLAVLVHRARHDIPFSYVFVAFGLFIVTCGLTHFMEIWTLWQPVYWLSGGVKVVTAVASVSTAIAMPFTVPRALVTIRDARLARDRELASARADALEAANLRLEAANAALAETNRALEATNVALQAARAEAERANRAKGDFLAVMSHELRTPLNAIGGFADIVRLGIHGPITEPQRDALDRIVRAQGHLLGLINDVLGYARLEAGHVEYHVAPVALAPLADEVIALVEPQRVAKRLSLDVALDDPAPGADGAPVRVVADREKLRQVLLNLFANAIKFTPAGGHLTLTVHERDGVPDALFVRLADTGIGIPRDRQETIFAPFVQVHAGYTREHEGSGLGLAISREYARG